MLMGEGTGWVYQYLVPLRGTRANPSHSHLPRYKEHIPLFLNEARDGLPTVLPKLENPFGKDRFWLHRYKPYVLCITAESDNMTLFSESIPGVAFV